eukprot:CAMPEP_0185762394 /NCGR_PEP_ID=MMETSP1174-20130828/21371_1 /TAXON_ID=35687 /ORGANISM="Dictyocha speculum, Strain CCMP1381" /LENGTH=384 /DNA_ID=CAMNT_0028444059 /DNA_START=123 /DNA_END=1275 /DNA_ORIENTATION=+
MTVMHYEEVSTTPTGTTMDQLPEILRRGYNARLLPKLPGILGLSAKDVRKDLHDIQVFFKSVVNHPMGEDDQSATSSIRRPGSRPPFESCGPVAPRGTSSAPTPPDATSELAPEKAASDECLEEPAQEPIPEPAQDEPPRDAVRESVHEALRESAARRPKRSKEEWNNLRRRMYRAELSREQLETQHLSLQRHLLFATRHHEDTRRRHHATLTGLQEMCRVEAIAMGAARLRNCGLSDLLMTLISRRKRTEDLDRMNEDLIARLREDGDDCADIISETENIGKDLNVKEELNGDSAASQVKTCWAAIQESAVNAAAAAAPGQMHRSYRHNNENNEGGDENMMNVDDTTSDTNHKQEDTATAQSKQGKQTSSRRTRGKANQGNSK